jgi:hypothetical protein
VHRRALHAGRGRRLAPGGSSSGLLSATGSPFKEPRVRTIDRKRKRQGEGEREREREREREKERERERTSIAQRMLQNLVQKTQNNKLRTVSTFHAHVFYCMAATYL